MTARDSPPPDGPAPRGPAALAAREATESLDLDFEPGAAPAHPSTLALGTHERRPPAEAVRPRPPSVPTPRRGSEAEEYLGCVLGSYRVLEVLGKGGMGYVFRAEHRKLGREVALKLLRGEFASRRDAVARFFQEARTVSRVRHRNIVEITDFVELDDGTTFLVMELLHGHSLGEWAHALAPDAGRDLPRALAVLVQICDGLAAAHAVGVVHRDLKPDNVLVVPTPDGAELVKLLDFGVAKLLHEDAAGDAVGNITAAGSVIGTPAYMSPEQAGGMAIDARSDIYSLGAIMYELFCGEPMFRGRSFGEYVRKHLTELPVPPRATAGGAHLAPAVEAVILRCLGKDPIQRYPTVEVLRDELLALLGSADLDGPARLTLRRIGADLDEAVTARARDHAAPATPDVARSGAAVAPPAPRAAAAPATSPSAPTMGMPPTSAPAPLPTFEAAARAARVTALERAADAEAPPLARPTARELRAAHDRMRPAARRPYLRWALGGAITVTLGASAALWWTEPQSPLDGPTPPTDPSRLTATPLAAPAVPAPPAAEVPAAEVPAAEVPAAEVPAAEVPAAEVPVRRTLVELRFDSEPPGGVYADGQSAELCQTPCAVNADPREAAGPRRRFVVRRAGYADGAIDVDLQRADQSYRVVLEPATATPTDPAAPAPRLGGGARPEPRRPARRDDPAARPPTRDRRSASEPARGVDPAGRAAAPTRADRDRVDDGGDRVDGDRGPADATPPPASRDDRPAKPRPAGRKPGAIDRADTLDPFERR